MMRLGLDILFIYMQKSCRRGRCAEKNKKHEKCTEKAIIGKFAATPCASHTVRKAHRPHIARARRKFLSGKSFRKSEGELKFCRYCRTRYFRAVIGDSALRQAETFADCVIRQSLRSKLRYQDAQFGDAELFVRGGRA